MCCCYCCRCCCEDFCDEYCDYDCDCFDWDDFKQLLREWREDYTIILTSHFSRIHARLVSQRNAYITMFFIGFFEFSVWILQIICMSEIIASPNMEFNLNNIDWDPIECDIYKKNYLRKCFKMSKHLLPISATLMCLGTFYCCYLCKPPYGLTIGIILRYPFAITMTVYSWFMYNIYSYFADKHCILSSSTDNANDLYDRILNIHSYLYRLCIYNTCIIIFMIPTLLLIYYIIFYICHLINKIICKCKLFIIESISNTPIDNNGYLDKSERSNLVEKSMADCPICMNSNIELILTKGCKHGSCRDCLYQYLITDLKNIGAYPRKCFMNDCEILLNYTNVEYVLTNNKELEEYDRMLIMSSTNGNNETIACPLCNAVMLKPKDIQRTLMQCVNENCKCDLCSQCGVLYHLNKTCIEYQNEIKYKTSGADDAFNQLTKAKKWCKCPNCGLVVERSEGCYHMTHYGCPGGGVERRTDFCYFCAEILMKKNGEGWRFSKITETKHFENGVYAECINADKIRNEEGSISINEQIAIINNNNINEEENENIQINNDEQRNSDIELNIDDLNVSEAFL
eukprot:276709_1